MTSENQAWVFHDGGRRDAGYTGAAGDCVTRAVAIASGLPFNLTPIPYERLMKAQEKQ